MLCLVYLKLKGTGLTNNQKAICDHFIYIPQYTNKTASLNIAVAGSIIFHHFASNYLNHENFLSSLVWAGYQETPIYHEKFQEQDPEGGRKDPAFQLKVAIHNKPSQNKEEEKDIEGDLNQLFE